MVTVSIPVAHNPFHCIFNVTVHIRPVNTDSGMSLEFLNAYVSLVDTFQEVWSLSQRNGYTVV